MKTPIKYLAEPKHVREVSLLGTADLDFWKARLEDEDLTPAERDGKAQLLIVAADMRFMGIRFGAVPADTTSDNNAVAKHAVAFIHPE